MAMKRKEIILETFEIKEIDTTDYDFCLKNAKKMTKRELLAWLNLSVDGKKVFDQSFCDRNMRINCFESVDISETKDTFDRWANSSELSFDLTKTSEKRKFIKLIKELREDFYTELNKIGLLNEKQSIKKLDLLELN